MVGEQQPPEPDWLRREQAVAQAQEAIGERFRVGSIEVGYDSGASDTGQVWIGAGCDECGAQRVMRASNRQHVYYLAMQLARYGCPANGHEQSGQIEMVGRVPRALGSMSIEALTDLEQECMDRLDDAQADVMIVQDIRQKRTFDMWRSRQRRS